jgi:5-formyltetrahydrofolate cyclo-ligase
MHTPTKSSLRETALLKRQALGPEEHAEHSRNCCTLLLKHIAQWEAPRIIAGYAPVKGELDITPALMALSGQHVLTLPVTVKGTKMLSFRHYMPTHKLKRGAFGIDEPESHMQEVIPDILLVPLLGFDRLLHRLGYGAGYYDATLTHLRSIKPIIAIGVAFAFQEVLKVPAAGFDQPLDAVVTEKEIITA